MPISTYTVPSSRLVHETKVDFSYRSVNRTIHVVQYDKQLPIIAVTLYVSGKLYTLPANFDVNVKFGKRDKTFIYKPVLGCNADRTVVYFEMDEQMTFLAGSVNPIIELSYNDNGTIQRAGSSAIAIEIERNPIQETDIESTNEYVDLNKAVEDAQAAQVAAEEAREAAETAREGIDRIVEDIDDIFDRKANRYIDEPIAELNNHTLREVFEESKISDDFTINSISKPTYEIWKLFTNNDYIIIINGKIDVRIQPYSIRFRNNFTDVSSSINPVFNNEYNNVFFKLEPNDIPNNLYFVRNFVEDTSLFVDYIYAIDLSMFTVEPTKEQMDYWFNVWQQYKDDNGLKSTVDSLQALKEKDSEIELKVTTIEEAYRKSQNGELTATKSGMDIISLSKDVAPAPLQVKVDGDMIPALENLVTNGDFSDGINDWNVYNCVLTNTNNELIVTSGDLDTASFAYQLLPSVYLENTVFYVTGKIKILNTDLLFYTIRFRNSNITVNYSNILKFTNHILNNYVTFKGSLQVNSVGNNDTIKLLLGTAYSSSETSNNKQVIWDDIQLFNLTASHGVTETTGPEYDKAVADIEAMLALNGGYILTTPIHAVGMNKRVRSVGKNLFDKTTVTLDGNRINESDGLPFPGNILTAGDGYTDYIAIQPSTSYIWSGQTSSIYTYAFYDNNKNYINYITYEQSFTTPSNARYVRISVFSDRLNYHQLEQGTIATSYAPYTNTDLYLQANKVGYKLPNGVADTIEYRNGKYYFVKRVQEYTLQASDITVFNSLTNVLQIIVSSSNLIGKRTWTNDVFGDIRILNFIERRFGVDSGYVSDDVWSIGKMATTGGQLVALYYELGTYASLAEAKADLAGTKIWYQLATPVETEILALGNAQGLSGGTVYIDDVMVDSNLYTSKYDIENTAYPIKSLDRIVKINADGSQTELAVSSATIAGDKLSFTHPSLVANDIVWIAYAYNVANLFKSNTFVTYYDNPFIAVQPNGTPRRIVFAVDDSGVVTVSSQAV